MDKNRVLFLYTQNSARSQMAEGMLNCLRGDRYQASSAVSGSDEEKLATFRRVRDAIRVWPDKEFP